MSEPSYTPHPLDDDHYDAMDNASQRPTDTVSPTTGAYKPLLRPSVIALIAGFGVAFLAGVAASNAQPNSSVETISSILNRLAVVVMLFGAFGILVAYRIPYFKKMAVRPTFPRWLRPGLASLLLCNLIGVAIFWLFCLTASVIPTSLFTLAIAGILVIYIALLVNMIVFHTGFLRAYAIGALTAAPLTGYLGMLGLWAFGPAMRRGAGGLSTTITFGGSITFMAITGLLCAAYVQLITHYYSETQRPDRDSED